MADRYVAVVNVDFTDSVNPHYQRILQALEGAGWEYVETSAMAYDGDLNGAMAGLEILSRALPPAGRLSALTVQIQRIGAGPRAPGPETPANALRNALANPGPAYP